MTPFQKLLFQITNIFIVEQHMKSIKYNKWANTNSKHYSSKLTNLCKKQT